MRLQRGDRSTRGAAPYRRGGGWRRRGFVVAMGALLALSAGCGGASPTPPDRDEARTTLERALTFWQEGGSIKALADANPPIIASDPRWEQGESISEFEVDGPPTPSGAQQKFRVKLRFNDAQGKSREVTAQYEVGTHPVQTVFRAMLQ